MQGVVFAVENIDVGVKTAIGNRMVYLGNFEDIDSVGMALLSAGIFHVCLTLVLILYQHLHILNGEQSIGESLNLPKGRKEKRLCLDKCRRR